MNKSNHQKCTRNDVLTLRMLRNYQNIKYYYLQEILQFGFQHSFLPELSKKTCSPCFQDSIDIPNKACQKIKNVI